MVDDERPCPGKISMQRDRPPANTAEQYTFRLIAPEW